MICPMCIYAMINANAPAFSAVSAIIVLKLNNVPKRTKESVERKINEPSEDKSNYLKKPPNK